MSPRSDLVNGKIKGYYIGYRAVNSSNHFIYKTVQPQDSSLSIHSLLLPSLRPFTDYAVILQAFNAVGAGPRSDEVHIKTSQSRPETSPPDIKCLPLSPESVKVLWNSLPAQKANGVLVGYRVSLVAVGPKSSRRSLDVGPDISHAIVSNLEKFTNYTVQVSAFTSVGEGPVNREEIFCRTNEDISSPITAVKVAHASADSVIVSWMQPDSPNGIIKTYTLHRRSTSDTKATTFTLPSHVRYFKASGLESALQQTFWVTSTNGAGESEPSVVVTTSMTQSGKDSSPHAVYSIHFDSSTWRDIINLDRAVICNDLSCSLSSFLLTLGRNYKHSSSWTQHFLA